MCVCRRGVVECMCVRSVGWVCRRGLVGCVQGTLSVRTWGNLSVCVGVVGYVCGS